MKTNVFGLAGAFCCFALLNSASASVLFDNGGVAGPTGRCDTQNTACGGTGWMVADDFILAANSTITGFTYNDYIDSEPRSAYTGTVWNVWNGNPFFGGTIVASGLSMGLITDGAAGSRLVTVNGLNVDLSMGTYWLGIQTQQARHGVWDRGHTDGAAGNAIQWDGPTDHSASDADNGLNRETPFTVLGTTATPEPSTLLLMAAGIGVVAVRRRSRVA